MIVNLICGVADMNLSATLHANLPSWDYVKIWNLISIVDFILSCKYRWSIS